MVRATYSVARHRRKKRMFKLAKGFWGDRKNHLSLSTCAVINALSANYRHRKEKKRNFRNLWVMRLSVATKINGMSYSKFIAGLKKAGCMLNRKVLSEMAIADPQGFTQVVNEAKQALAV